MRVSHGGDDDDDRVAKCHGYDGYIRVKILSVGVKVWENTQIWQNQVLFGEDLYNICKISVTNLA